MITNDDILNMNFYKKEKFTGSYQGMRYLIKKDAIPAAPSDSAGADAPPADAPAMTDVFLVTIWPGPYNFASTDDDKKTSATFPFTPEGKEAVVAWLNEQWQSRKSEWPAR
ncbi:MAG: GNAT family acetyltransferase [Roseburia sp.]|nr:GNAT family acetyltransferase [Roseburia sp.]